jgi:hypothetical protein
MHGPMWVQPKRCFEHNVGEPNKCSTICMFQVCQQLQSLFWAHVVWPAIGIEDHCVCGVHIWHTAVASGVAACASLFLLAGLACGT